MKPGLGVVTLALLLLPVHLAGQFPADSQKPDRLRDADLLETICPGRIAWGKETVCQIPCPTFTGFPGQEPGWSFSAITRGHFQSPESEDAVVAAMGCEPHSENFGGSILLTRRQEKWTMLWYKAGVPTDQCHKIPLLSQREILVCMGESGGQGNKGTSLYVEDLLRPAEALMVSNGPDIFRVVDNVGTCGWNNGVEPPPLTHAFIEEVRFATNHAGKQTLSVIARYGRRSMTRADVDPCTKAGADAERFAPPTKRYQIDFVFDGQTYQMTPSAARAALIFQR